VRVSQAFPADPPISTLEKEGMSDPDLKAGKLCFSEAGSISNRERPSAPKREK